MTTDDLIELLQELQADAEGPVRVQVLVRSVDRNLRLDLDQYDVELKNDGTGQVVLIDLS